MQQMQINQLHVKLLFLLSGFEVFQFFTNLLSTFNTSPQGQVKLVSALFSLNSCFASSKACVGEEVVSRLFFIAKRMRDFQLY
jgi:hypothetical protein